MLYSSSMTIVILFLSLIALLWSANHLVVGASGVGLYYRLPPLLTGLTLVALGTSTPEIMIAISASIEGYNDIAIGNAIGTNIANIGLVLFLFIVGLEIETSVIKKNARYSMPIALGGMVLPFGLGAALAVPIYNR